VWLWAAAGAAADAGVGRRWGSPPSRLGIGLGVLGFEVAVSRAGDLRKGVGARGKPDGGGGLWGGAVGAPPAGVGGLTSGGLGTGATTTFLR
jgi:hypothetical protein